MPLHITKGFTPTRKLGSGYNNAGLNLYTIANGYGSNIGFGDPVKLSAGTLKLATNTSPVLGIFQGVKFIDSEGRLQVKKNFVAGTSSKGGIPIEGTRYTQPVAMVADDPDQTYIIQALTTVTPAQLGKTCKVSAIGSVTPVNGNANCVVDVLASVGTSGGHMVTIIGLWTEPENKWNNAPIGLEVKLSRPGIVGAL